MAIVPGPAVDPPSGPGKVIVRGTPSGPDMMSHSTVMSGPDMTGHGTGPDMIKEHSDMMTDPVVISDPVVMPPVPRPGPHLMTDHGTVISEAPPMTDMMQ